MKKPVCKLPLSLKITLFVLFSFASLLYASNNYAQRTMLNISSQTRTVSEVLTEIEKQTDFTFFYNNKQVDLKRKVTLNVKNENVFSVLKKLFSGTNTTYKVLDKNIILSEKSAISSATKEVAIVQQVGRSVKGVVVDDKGEPVIGPTGYVTGYYVSELPNAELGWEYSSTWNFGLDFTLLRGRLSGTFEYYIQKTTDLLQSVSLPSTSGVSSYMANVGKTENKGFEFTLNGTILDNHNGWTWEASLNLSANRNKLTELASGSKDDKANNWFVGHPIDCIYDYEKVGLWNSDDPDFQYLDILEPGGNEGMIKVKYTGDRDASGKPTRAIGPEDRQIISLEPKFQGGFSTRVAYKGFDLNVITAFRCGGKLISTLHHSNGYLNMLTGRRGQVDVDYWTPENKGAKYPKPGGIQSGDNPKYGSTLGYFDSSYWKVRNITLGYNFEKQAWLTRMGIQSLRAYLSVQNPFIICSPFHKETGLDPETNSYGNENVAVTEGIQKRFLTVGTNSPPSTPFSVLKKVGS